MMQEATIRWGPFEKRLTLTSAQQLLLADSTPLAIISGPPGCGKSVTLMLKGLEWLKKGHDVIVFGLHSSCMPASRLVYWQLCQAYKDSQGPLFPKDRTWGQLKYEHAVLRDARNLEATLRALQRHGSSGLHVLMDDFCPEDGFTVEMMLVFMRDLRRRVPDLHLWATNSYSKVPEDFRLHVLTQPIRYPLPLMHEIRVAVEVLKGLGSVPDSHGYSDDLAASVVYSPQVIHVRHSGGKGDKRWPINSAKCGKQVAHVLQRIGVGPQSGANTEKYQFRDVLILTRSPVDPRNPPQAFLRGLQTSGIPTQVFPCGAGATSDQMENALDNFILAKENKVTLMTDSPARGLDRPVVVCLTGALPDEHYQLTPQARKNLAESMSTSVTFTPRLGPSVTATANPTSAEVKEAEKVVEGRLKARMELVHRLDIWSRASCQLIVVHLPKGMEGGPSGSEDYGDRKCIIL
ncbi:uncharacterized protein LOC143290173 [Babylonia areolata]|uniref:uncharacterized protein LOC143290173 n=1 Tax=Babylonia areolata TaxID=304850 RepID=UPI003FD37038